MKTPQVTVLTSVFNGIEYLEEAVNSILGQSFADFEFLIVNDGSTEPVIRLLRQFRDPRIKLIDQENMGLTRSLNKGISLSRGKYIARMDADDVSLPQRIERQVAAMEANARLDMVACDYEVVDKDGTVRDRKTLIHDHLYRLWRLQFHNVYGHGTTVLRKRAIVAAGGYDESFLVAQDYELWSRLSRLNNTLVIPEVLYQYRSVDRGSQSSVKHYEAQVANAIRTSNRNLTACRPDFTDNDCEEVRSVFWKFQRPTTSARGIELLPDLLEGFFARYGIGAAERDRLLRLVLRDVASEVDLDNAVFDSEKPKILHRLRKSLEHRWADVSFS